MDENLIAEARYMVTRTESYPRFATDEMLSALADTLEAAGKDVERWKSLAVKMHTWVFLHTYDEQKAYDEIGLTDEENVALGYSGQFEIKEDRDDAE